MTGPSGGPKTMTDTQLMQAVARGDRAALGELFDRHHVAVYRQCLGLTGSRQDAEDLVQEVFMRIGRYASSFKGDAAFTTWLYRMVRNVCLDHFGRTARIQVVDLDAPGVAAATEHAESTAEHGDLLERLLERLTFEQREIIVLSRQLDFGYPEIARALGITVNAARVRLHRALHELKTRYAEVTA